MLARNWIPAFLLLVPGCADGSSSEATPAIDTDAATTETSTSPNPTDTTPILEIVRMSWGRRSDAPDNKVEWNIEEYRGEKLRIVIDDPLTGEWGFVGATGFTLE